MLHPMYKLTISYDDQSKVFVPELQETDLGQGMGDSMKADILEGCLNDIIRAFRGSSKKKEG